ncbi:hypothetical protein CR513_59690, partial [Mucuna pruriens]
MEVHRTFIAFARFDDKENKYHSIDFAPKREQMCKELMTYIIHTKRCHDIICIGPKTFIFEIVSRHLHIVLHEIIVLEGEFFAQPLGKVVSPQILNNNIFYPFFKLSFDIHLINYVSLLMKLLSNFVNLFLYKGLPWSHKWYVPISEQRSQGVESP